MPRTITITVPSITIPKPNLKRLGLHIVAVTLETVEAVADAPHNLAGAAGRKARSIRRKMEN